MTMSAAQKAGEMGKPLDTLQRIELAEGVDIELRPAGVMGARRWRSGAMVFVLNG
jgi:hypothetical protein